MTGREVLVLGEGDLEPFVRERVEGVARLLGLASMDRTMGDLGKAMERLLEAVSVLDGSRETGASRNVPAVGLAMGFPEVIQSFATIVDAVGNVELDSGKLDTPRARTLDDLFSEQLYLEAERQVDDLRANRAELSARGLWDQEYFELAEFRARKLRSSHERMVADGVSVGPVSRRERVEQVSRLRESRKDRRARERAEAKTARRGMKAVR